MTSYLAAMTIVLMLVATVATAAPTTQAWSTRMADSIMIRNPRATTIERYDEATGPKWTYAVAFAVRAVGQVGVQRDEPKYVQYARDYMNAFVSEQGLITTPTYKPQAFKLDDVAPGTILLMLDRADHDPRWLKAAQSLTSQLERQPRTSDGGFWHKQIYPNQMWLDGIFMASPFMAEYGRATGERRWCDEAVHQILTIAKHARDSKTGLYFHGFDESRSQRWADKTTGVSPCIWGRAVGWYIMGIVQTLEHLPADHPRRGELVTLLANLADAVGRVQDPQSGLWYQVLDQPKRAGNYLESSASCMFVFALAKGVRLGVLETRHLDVAKRGYAGILRQFIEEDPKTGVISLKDTCQVAGLGGTPYRDGSFEYYVGERRVSNDPKGLAPFILASLELER